MGMTFTKEQQQVIDLRDRNLLVSAAAGSGKTAVLVERIISRITENQHPIDIDRLLIVTFTNAAAAEMKERIGAAIEKKLAEQPSDSHLQRQQTLLHNAQITTIHSFCLYVIRNYFHRINLEPDFRIGEEGELKLLQQDVLKGVLENHYQENTPEFLNLTETIATGKTDEKLKETILTLYHFAMSDPWPEEWLKKCTKPYSLKSPEEFEQLPMYRALMTYLKDVTSQWVQMMERCVRISQETDGPQMYQGLLEQEYEMLQSLLSCDSYSAYAAAVGALAFGRLPAVRKFAGDEKKKLYVQELRNEIKDSRKKLMEQFFFLPWQQMVENLGKNGSVIRMLVQVTLDFMENFRAKKREKNMLDFNDLEHLALEILVDRETREPSQTALELRSQFAEVMVDEYQDSNYVQETILRSVAGEHNMFMVGDVKQSIYRFRMARPELFMEKYDTYTSENGENRKIDLHRNFRSRGEVLQTVNDIFYYIMHKDLGNVEYDKQAALYQGMEFVESREPDMFRAEILLTDPEEWKEAFSGIGEAGKSKEAGETVDAGRNGKARDFGEAEEIGDTEGVMIAAKIRQLLSVQQVTDKQTGQLRPMKYGDVVILLRSLGSYGTRLAEVLKMHGIPAMTTAGTGYFSAVEVQTMLNMLRLLDNPRQDIPMAAVLKSPMAGLTEEELAKIRIPFRDCPFYQSVFSYAETGEDTALREKLRDFLKKIEDFRKRIPDTSIHELLYQVMDETGYLNYVYALPGGQVRRANLEMLLEKAIAYEKTSYHGLFHFIRYINQLQKYEVDFAEAVDENNENVVRIMTIHKSKGLEFPVVFVAGLGRQLNQQDVRARMVLHPRYGIGLDITDLERRVRTPSLLRQILARQIQMENAGEELRVLYVALTRAKEKLILTGTLKKAEEKLEEYAYRSTDSGDSMGFLSRLKAGCYLDWVLPALIRKEYPVHVMTPTELAEPAAEQAAEQEWSRELILQMSQHPQPELAHEISGRLSYRYAYENERDIKPKLSVSELKHRAIDRLRQEENDTRYIFEEPKQMPYVPEFMATFLAGQQTAEEEVRQAAARPEENIGALRGTAMHRVLECFDFSREPDSLSEQLEEMCADGRLEQRLSELVSLPNLKLFLNSELAGRMHRAARAGKLYKEKPFVMGKEARQVDPETDSDVMVLIQGIIDAFFEEDGKLVLVDYKTDAVKTAEELAKRYQAQMDLYQEALEKATGKRVKEKILYSFRLKEIIQV